MATKVQRTLAWSELAAIKSKPTGYYIGQEAGEHACAPGKCQHGTHMGSKRGTRR
jgi:hypothetical protein